MFSDDLVCDILTYINENIYHNITIDELSKKFHFNRSYIMKKFKKELSISIINFINSMRIYNSLKSYESNEYVLKIALMNGFNSLEYYSEMFKKIMDVNPKTYKMFINSTRNIRESEFNKIRQALIKLQFLKEKDNTYRDNRRPNVSPVKKLSIFK